MNIPKLERMRYNCMKIEEHEVYAQMNFEECSEIDHESAQKAQAEVELFSSINEKQRVLINSLLLFEHNQSIQEGRWRQQYNEPD